MNRESRILCVDIGGTWIKAAVLPDGAARRDVEQAVLHRIPSLGWLNESLPRLLSPENPAWSSRLERGPDAIRVALPGPVGEGRHLGRTDLLHRGVPRDLKGAFEQHAGGPPVSLIKDADAWAVGAIRFAELFGTTLEFPFLTLTFGTAVGVSAAMSPVDVVSLEISATPADVWVPLASVATHPIAESWQVHRILGRDFFDWVEKEQPHWSFERIRREFTARVIAFVRAAREHLEADAGGFRKLVIGGGNAEFVLDDDLAAGAGLEVGMLLRPAIGIDPYLIPLLGLSHYEGRVTIGEAPA